MVDIDVAYRNGKKYIIEDIEFLLRNNDDDLLDKIKAYIVEARRRIEQ